MAVNRMLDEIIEDPRRFIDRVERTGEQVARGIDQVLDEYEKDPRKTGRELLVHGLRGLAKLGKQRLRGPG